MSTVYCTAPWRGLHIDPTGDVKVCCAGRRGALGNLNSNSIQQILSGPALSQLRQDILADKPSDYCEICRNSEKYGGSSERHWHLEIDKDFDLDTADLAVHRPSIIDARWNNTCNLKCVYCSPMASSRWAAAWGHRVDTSTRHYYDQITNLVRENSESLREVALVGGEPLLLKENLGLIDSIPEQTQIVVITNLSLDLERNEIFQKLRKRRKVSWSISFENVGDRFEFVRDGARWDQLKANLETVRTLRETSGHSCGIHAVFNVFSATRLGEILEFAQQQDMRIMWQTLTYPPCLDPLMLGSDVCQLVRDEIDRVMQHRAAQPYVSYFDSIKQQSSQTKQSNLRAQFGDMVRSRSTLFLELWPELEFLLR